MKVIIIKCSKCGVPFFKIYNKTKQMSFLKWIDGSPKETFFKGKITKIKCPKCNNEIGLDKSEAII